MKNNILILARAEQYQNTTAFSKAFSSIGEYVNEISMLYTILKERAIDLILIAENFPGLNAGIVKKIRRRAPFVDIWEITESSYDKELDDETYYNGFINPAVGPKAVKEIVTKILGQKELLRKFGMVGLSSKIKVVAETIDRIAPTDISVLVIGPSGSGKELVASAIHNNSARSGNKFMAVNCGALAEGVLESELFGHEKGAFTGAVGRRDGLFRQADGGSIFLDEIGETRPSMQVKLLRVLEGGSFYPVGSDVAYRSNARVIAATNRDLNDAIAEGLFREDLYFRLGVVKINLPPLNERRADILPLLYYFSELEGLEGFSERALDLLIKYDWPGNIRQLRNFVSRAGAMKSGGEVSISDVEQFINEQGVGPKNLPVVTGHTSEEAGHELIYHALISLGNEIRMLKDLILANLPAKDSFETEEPTGGTSVSPLSGSVEDMERELVTSILKITGGNRREAARRLGMGERTLYRKLKKYDLN